ncbi:hypothetical protein [Muricoccus nepalensis]|uniref:hypothetical protein n=1 Tax=Muricoccus nepalensis TaxID=1854500 RepID=UPI001128E328|nr:hypothetical protein [Roseomonas nepalensis]
MSSQPTLLERSVLDARSARDAPGFQIVVERHGHGAQVWHWYLLDEGAPSPTAAPLAASKQGFRSAEEAYDAATSQLKQLQQTS